MAKKYLYNEGEVINNSKILKRILMKNNKGDIKGYSVECVICGYIYDKNEYNLKNGNKCPCCTNNIIVTGINDIATKSPYLIKYFVNPEDAKKHGCYSNQKLPMNCPYCGYKKTLTPNKLSTKGFSCNQCGDGISYPNKFVTNILIQLGIEFELEKTFGWSNKKKYDIYIPSLEMIIENHGSQHYGNYFRNGNKTIEEEQENDKYKKELALNNGVKHYIELDCRESEMDWIKQSIMNSELPKLFNFKEENINWVECDKYSTKSLAIKACELWNSGIKSTTEIAEILKIHSATVNKYLKQGKIFNMVDYDTKEIMRENGRQSGKKSSKKVYMYDLDMNFIGEFESCSDLAKQSEELFGVKLSVTKISAVCLEKNKTHKGYIFSYKLI